MARSPGQPFKDLLVEAFQDLDAPAPRAILDDEERAIDPREETRPDRRRPRLREDTVKDLPSPFSLVDDFAFGDIEVVIPVGEPTRPVDLHSIAASIRAAPASLPVAIGAHTSVYRFTLDGADELEPLEPAMQFSSTPAPVPEVLVPTPPRPATKARAERRPRALDTRRDPSPTSSRDGASAAASTSRASGPHPKTSRERAQGLYLEALDALAARRVDDARTLVGQAVALAPKDTQYRALYRDLYGARPSSTTKRR